MEPYIHTVQFYETDKMAIVHHSNYVRWMEESRVDFMKKAGYPFEKLEAAGFGSAVTALDCKYKSPCRFPERIRISCSILEFRGVRMKIGYTMTKEDGTLVFEGHTEHCFLNREGKPVNTRKAIPEFYEIMSSLLVPGTAENKQ